MFLTGTGSVAPARASVRVAHPQYLPIPVPLQSFWSCSWHTFSDFPASRHFAAFSWASASWRWAAMSFLTASVSGFFSWANTGDGASSAAETSGAHRTS